MKHNREFSWNRNAPTNREAVIQFAALSFAGAVIPTVATMAVCISLRVGGVIPTTTLLLLVPTVFMACFLLLFLTLFSVYNLANKGHERERQTPLPHEESVKKNRVIKGAVSGKRAKIVFDK